MTAQEFAAVLRQGGWKVQENPTDYRAQCPAHGGEDLNLSFEDGDRELLVTCWSHQCEFGQIMEAAEKAAGIKRQHQKNGAGKHGLERVVARYQYHSAKGELLYEVRRYEPKNFRPFHLDSRNEWTPGLPRSIPRVLYRLPELLQANPKEIVFLCNGEKAVDTLRKRGLTATCSQGGESIRWRDYPQYVEPLKGRFCVILQDNDPAGEAHTREVFQTLTEAGIRAKKLLLPSLPEGGDVCDWLGAGATTEELLEEAKPEPHPLMTVLLSREALRNLPPPVWQIEGLFYEQSIVEIYGESNHGKSLVGMDIALNMVRGTAWADRPILKPGPVLYVNADGGPGFSPRLKAWERANGTDSLFEFWTYPMELLIADPRQMASFTEGLADLEEPPAMVVIDTLSQCIPGVNENQQDEMSRVVAHLNAIKRRYGCTIVLLHHVGKDGLNRGSTVIPGAADTIIRVTQQPGELVELRCDKQRDGRKFLPFYFQIHSHGEDEGVYLTPAAGPVAGGEAREEKEQQVLEALQVNGGWLTREEVRSRVLRMSAASVYRYLKRLVAEGLVAEDERVNAGGHAEKVYLFKQPLV